MDYLSSYYCANSKKILILADFNYPSFVLNAQSSQVDDSSIIRAFMTQTGLHQYNYMPNTLNRLLDLVFSGLHCNVDRCLTTFLRESDRHLPLSILVYPVEENTCGHAHKSADKRSNVIKQYNFQRADGKLLYLRLADLDWSDLHSFTDVDSMCDCFYMKIYTCLDGFVPLKGPKRFSSRFPPWYTSEILYDLKLKEKHRLLSADGEYMGLRRSISMRVKAAYDEYVRRAEDSLSHDPKRF